MDVRLRFLMCFCFVLLGIYGFYDVQGDPPQFLPLPEVELRPVPEVVDAAGGPPKFVRILH